MIGSFAPSRESGQNKAAAAGGAEKSYSPSHRPVRQNGNNDAGSAQMRRAVHWFTQCRQSCHGMAQAIRNNANQSTLVHLSHCVWKALQTVSSSLQRIYTKLQIMYVLLESSVVYHSYMLYSNRKMCTLPLKFTALIMLMGIRDVVCDIY